MNDGDAAEQLQWLAKRSAQEPTPVEAGRFSYIQTRGLYGASDYLLDDDGSLNLIAERLEPTEREFWISANGAGRIEETPFRRTNRNQPHLWAGRASLLWSATRRR